ncbi:MAG: CcoQ/FixQ family Cbb3-type cytochrome c oxidase assembly chaperone [Oligoflexia bacterium]|nr:CcoQ/FixQ family Cbb3-type cytochrome c oxidase assembly chaperone [Oligoflexia bacterium]
MIAEFVRNNDLTIFPQISLVIFLITYAIAIYFVMSPRRKKTYEVISKLPLAGHGDDKENS